MNGIMVASRMNGIMVAFSIFLKNKKVIHQKMEKIIIIFHYNLRKMKSLGKIIEKWEGISTKLKGNIFVIVLAAYPYRTLGELFISILVLLLAPLSPSRS